MNNLDQLGNLSDEERLQIAIALSVETFTKTTLSLPDAIMSYILTSESKQRILFFGMGAANNIKQQKLRMINNIKQRYPQIPVYYFFIDPTMQSPPLCLQNNEKKLDNNWVVDDKHDNVYHNEKTDEHVYSFGISIKYIGRDFKFNQDCVNIIDYLKTLCTFTIENEHLMFVHDFSGGYINILASMFDKEIGIHKDKIIIDVANRKYSNGCCLDPTKEECMYSFFFVKRNERVFVLNPYNIPHKDIVQVLKQANNDKQYVNMILCMIDNKINSFFLDIYSRYRPIYRYYTKDSISENKIHKKRIFGLTLGDYIPVHYKDLTEMFEMYKKNLDDTKTVDMECLGQLSNGLYKIMQVKLTDLLGIVFGDDADKEAKILLEQIPKLDYKWSGYARQVIKKNLEERGVNLDNKKF